MGVKIDTSEVVGYCTRLKNSGRTVGAKASAVFRKTVLDIEADAKMLVEAYGAVDTGNLLNSVSSTITGGGRNGLATGEIGPTAEYGIYVHEGTSRMAGRPFLTDAFDRRVGPFEDALAAVAESEL